MNELDMSELVGEVQRQLNGMKEYAGYFTGPDRVLNEYGAVGDWAEAFLNGDDQANGTVVPRGKEDPPDCEIRFADGRAWAVEVTEMVDQVTRCAWEQERCDSVPDYTFEYVRAGISACLARKEMPAAKLRGGPYDRRILLITCDEVIGADLFRRVTNTVRFRRPEFAEEGYVMLPPPVKTGASGSTESRCVVVALRWE